MPLYYSLILISELKIMVSQLTHNFEGSVRSFESMSALIDFIPNSSLCFTRKHITG